MNHLWGRRGPGRGAEPAAPDPTTAHQLVRDLEQSIAGRLAALDEDDDDVARARVEAEHLVAEARVLADEAARERTAAILCAARAEAKRLVEAGTCRATQLRERASTQLESDIAAVVASVLPEGNSSSREEAS